MPDKSKRPAETSEAIPAKEPPKGAPRADTPPPAGHPAPKQKDGGPPTEQGKGPEPQGSGAPSPSTGQGQGAHPDTGLGTRADEERAAAETRAAQGRTADQFAPPGAKGDARGADRARAQAAEGMVQAHQSWLRETPEEQRQGMADGAASRMEGERKAAGEEMDKSAEELERLAQAEKDLQQELAELRANSIEAKEAELRRIQEQMAQHARRHAALAANAPASEEQRRLKTLGACTENELKQALAKLKEEQLARMSEEELLGEFQRRGLPLP